MTKQQENKWFLKGGRGSGRTFRLLCETFENKIADIKANCDLAIEGRDVKIMELEKENAELKNKLTEKVTLESLDVVSAKMNDLEKENAELKHNKKTVVHLADCLEEKMKERIADLEKENAELRNNGFTVSAMTEQQLKAALEKGEQLEKQLEVAKDLIHQFLIQNPISDWLPKKAEQFLKEIEK